RRAHDDPRRGSRRSSAQRPGLIAEPGMFEGEAIFVPAIWAACLECGPEELWFAGDPPVWLWPVEADDRASWPEIPAEAATLALWQSDNGFVVCKPLTAA